MSGVGDVVVKICLCLFLDKFMDPRRWCKIYPSRRDFIFIHSMDRKGLYL